MPKWYEKYKKLNSCLFIYENSAKGLRSPAPFKHKSIEDDDLVRVKHYPNSLDWEIMGYTLNPSFNPTYSNFVAIMFHNIKTGEKLWAHFNG